MGAIMRRADHAARRGAPSTASTSSASAPGAASRAGGRAAHAPRTTSSQSLGHGRPSRPSPLVTTITKIVGVVPMRMWIINGILFALTLALGLRSRVEALRARRLERQRGQLLEDVGLLQAALLPVVPARLGPVGTSVAYRPADGPGAGGDFYDVFALEDGRLGVIVGDVSGHGRQALPHTALVRFTLRAYLEAGLQPRVAVRAAGAVLDHQLEGSFVTVVAAIYHPRERTFVYACAGHPPPIVLGEQPLVRGAQPQARGAQPQARGAQPLARGAQPIVPITICSSPPIGAGIRTGTRQTVVSVPGAAKICLHTDGVTDARVGSELFGAERLVGALGELGPQATAPALLKRVAAASDRRPDDMAACLLRVEGGADAPRVVVEEIELDREEAAGDRVERFLLACGVAREEIPELLRSAEIAVGRTGTAVLELAFGEGAPRVAVRHDNVVVLHAPPARVGVGLGAAR